MHVMSIMNSDNVYDDELMTALDEQNRAKENVLEDLRISSKFPKAEREAGRTFNRNTHLQTAINVENRGEHPSVLTKTNLSGRHSHEHY